MKKTAYILIFILTLILVSCKPYNRVRKIVAENNMDSLHIVTLKNKVYHGRGEIPNLSSKSVLLMTSNEEIIEISSSEIDYLLAWNEKQNVADAYKFVYTKVKEYESLDPKNNNKNLKKEPRWLLKMHKENDLSLYVEHQEYNIKKKGRIDGHTIGVVSIPPSVWYYIKKKDQEFPVRVGLDESAGAVADKYFKNMGQKFFSDYPALAKKIKDGDLDTKHIKDAMKEYSTAP